MTAALHASIALVQQLCPACGAVYGLAEEVYFASRRDKNVVFRCTNPRCSWPSQGYGGSDLTQTKKELEAARKATERANAARRWAEQGWEEERRRATAYKGHVTRLKKRVAAGVCPCCHRSFEDLRRHMEAKHPDFVE